MPVTEADRHRSTRPLKSSLGPQDAETFMNLMPPANWTEFAMKSDIAELRTELKTDIAELRTELKTDIAELKIDIAELRTELKSEIADRHRELLRTLRHLAVREPGRCDRRRHTHRRTRDLTVPLRQTASPQRPRRVRFATRRQPDSVPGARSSTIENTHGCHRMRTTPTVQTPQVITGTTGCRDLHEPHATSQLDQSAMSPTSPNCAPN